MRLESDAARLRHMVEAAQEAISYADGRAVSDLESDRPLLHSLTRCVEILSEAAARVTPETREAHPEIPWSRIVGMRNRLIHAYFDVNHEILWQTVISELPGLLACLEAILNEADGGE